MLQVIPSQLGIVQDAGRVVVLVGKERSVVTADAPGLALKKTQTAARRSAGIPHKKVYPAVLILEGIDADSTGVMATTQILAPKETGRVLIAAKKGLGLRVVGGHAIPEQILYSLDTEKIEVLTHSLDDIRLEFASGKKGLQKRKNEPGQRGINPAGRRSGGVPDWALRGLEKNTEPWERYAQCRTLETGDESYCGTLDSRLENSEAADASSENPVKH